MPRKKYSLLILREALQHSWNVDTTYCIPCLNHRNPSKGQCLVSSMVLQHFLGGQIMKGNVDIPNKATEGHYWLRLNGVDIDLTWHQFPRKAILHSIEKDEDEHTGRVQTRYNILLKRVKEYLKTK